MMVLTISLLRSPLEFWGIWKCWFRPIRDLFEEESHEDRKSSVLSLGDGANLVPFTLLLPSSSRTWMVCPPELWCFSALCSGLGCLYTNIWEGHLVSFHRGIAGAHISGERGHKVQGTWSAHWEGGHQGKKAVRRVGCKGPEARRCSTALALPVGRGRSLKPWWPLV